MPATVTRVRSGRRRRNYRAAVEAYALYQRYLRRVRRDAIRDAVENHALVTSRDPVLLELLCAFALVKALRKHGWLGSTAGLVRTPLLFRGHRDNASVDVFYQHTPPQLSAGSIYRTVQKEHAFAVAGGLIPDLVLRVKAGDTERWALVEVKGVERSVTDSARAAINASAADRALDTCRQPGASRSARARPARSARAHCTSRTPLARPAPARIKGDLSAA
jgi:hypothetical protein